MTPNASFGRSLTVGSLLGLGAGILLGAALRGSEGGVLASAAQGAETLGRLWARALQAIVLPLVISLLLTAVLSERGKGVGRLGGVSVALFVALLILGAAFAWASAPPLIERFVDPGAPTAAVAVPEAARSAEGGKEGVTDWLVGLVPVNPIRSAMEGDILQVLLFTIFFGIAVRRIAEARRRRLTGCFESLAEAMMAATRLLIRFTPIGVFGLALAFAREAGLAVAHVLALFVAIVSGLLLAHTLLLYPVTALLGRVPLRRFAEAAYPAQLVAIGTRSSLASVPALLEGARRKLPVPHETLDFAVPFAASLFKGNRTVSAPVKLFFLAHLYGIPLEPVQVVAFVVTTILLSFSAVGIPGGGGSLRNLPAYAAVGIPVEGYLLLEAVDVIPDVFKTLNNTTGYLSVAVLLSRLTGASEAPRVEAALADEGAPA